VTDYSFVVGVDPSLTCSGVAVWSVSGFDDPASTVVKVPTIAAATLRDDGRRISQMVRRVNTFIDEETFTARSLVLMEGPIPHMRNAGKQHERAGIFWGIAAHCLKFADVARVPPDVLKKYWTGNGNASKELMVECVGRQWEGRRVATDDEADALALAHKGVRAIRGPSPWLYPADATMLRQVDWPAEFKGREQDA
jgi:crossover junction endodeoxyribonuclease RuvC